MRSIINNRTGKRIRLGQMLKSQKVNPSTDVIDNKTINKNTKSMWKSKANVAKVSLALVALVTAILLIVFAFGNQKH
jgi:hypothetical protein